MTVPAPPTLTPAPSPAPTRADPANFRPRADAYHTWLVPHVNTELPAILNWVHLRAGETQIGASVAVDAAVQAQAAALSASVSSNATKWVSGTTYAEGAAVWSPANFSNYRRKVAGAGTIDPASDPANWEPITGIKPAVVMVSAAANAQKFTLHVFTAGLIPLFLPPSPQPGDWVAFSNRSGEISNVIIRNGQNIMGLNEDMTVDNINYFATLVFADASRGWIFK
jgi:hypothetical protein